MEKFEVWRSPVSSFDGENYWHFLVLALDCSFLFSDEIYSHLLKLSLGERRASRVDKSVL
jgi:hypothetical protein